ncbi:ParB/RepB/Spo0J family partition protein [Bacillus sp. Marseille-P3661]|uniref:ParB/RepB/Spo0J family partition protein n=1 Tax=Bacillus sp. Marseille-P3661 TaxID=1936234 RepID=UPI000C82A846|nr:ParB/RepB/Spo0J family partition protein [Bacillus sp. Marseille-P3661]
MAKGLGKGIGAFFSDVGDVLDQQDKIQEVKVKECRPNPYQPRKTFDDDSIQELKESIENHGILQPIVVRKSIKGFDIVVGERRYRAAKAAGLDTIPVIVRDYTEQQMMELALIENLQREDLNPVEEAQAYQTLIEQLKLTQEELSKRLGKSRPHIANHIRLLTLPAPVQTLISKGELTMGHGRTLLGLKNKENIVPLAEKIKKENLNVRQVEQLVQRLNETVPRETKKPQKDVFIKQQESRLRDRFGTSVAIKQNKNKGKIEIEFYSPEDLNRILELLEDEQLN